MDPPEALQELFHAFLYMPESDDDLRTISNTGDVILPAQEESCFRCAYCDKVMGRVAPEDAERKEPISCWRKCESVLYCSHACQNDDWNSHRKLCTEVRRCRTIVRDLSTEYGETNGVMDVFDRENNMVFHFGDPIRGLGSVGQNYLTARFNLVQAYMQQAMAPMVATAAPISSTATIQTDNAIPNDNNNDETDCHYTPPPHWNRRSLELVLEHCLDLLHLDPIQTDSGTVRTLVVHCLIVLERYQELYEFVKYWNTIPYKLRSIKRKEPVFSEFDEALNFALDANTFLNVQSPQPFFENQTELVLRPPSSTTNELSFPGPSQAEVIAVLYLALAKLLVYQAVEGIRFVQSISPSAVQSDLIMAHIAGFLGIQTDWMATDGETIRKQCRELLAFAEASIPGILQDLVVCPVPSDKPSSSLERLKTAWISHQFPWSFLLDYLRKESASKKCQVPRHEFLQRVFDRVYATYFELKTMHGLLDQIQNHWDREKDSPGARRLLLEEMENGSHLYQFDFCATRIVSALAEENLNTQSNIEVLLGDAHLVEVAMDVDIFLARQHLEKVRHLPEVANITKANDVHVPDEDIDAEGLETVVCGLTSADLATENNLKLLFGDGGRVHNLMRKANTFEL